MVLLLKQYDSVGYVDVDVGSYDDSHGDHDGGEHLNRGDGSCDGDNDLDLTIEE